MYGAKEKGNTSDSSQVELNESRTTCNLSNISQFAKPKNTSDTRRFRFAEKEESLPRRIHDYSEIHDIPPNFQDSSARANPSLGDLGSLSRQNISNTSSYMASSKSSINDSLRQSGRKTNEYSALDKKSSYFTLEPHIQVHAMPFKKDQKKVAQNYNALDY